MDSEGGWWKCGFFAAEYQYCKTSGPGYWLLFLKDISNSHLLSMHEEAPMKEDKSNRKGAGH